MGARQQADLGLSRRIARAFPALAAVPGLVERVAAAGTHRRAGAGTVLFDECSPCGGFPLVLEGIVRVVQHYPNGRELMLYRVKPGDLCILSCGQLLSDTRFDAVGTAETPVEIVVLPPGVFRMLIAESEDFGRFAWATLAERMADVLHLVEAVARHRLDQRLATILIESADENGVINATHQSLADSLGSVREIVSRLLGNFEDRRWVRLGRERVTIVDRRGLASLASS
jgi:CRP/FNR family transcriptional regulator